MNKAKVYNQSSFSMKVFYTLKLFEITEDGKSKLEPFMLIPFIPAVFCFVFGMLEGMLCLVSLVMTIAGNTQFVPTIITGACLFAMMLFCLLALIRIMAGFEALKELRELITSKGRYTRIESEDDPRYIAMEKEYAAREEWAHQRVKELTREWEQKNTAQ